MCMYIFTIEILLLTLLYLFTYVYKYGIHTVTSWFLHLQMNTLSFRQENNTFDARSMDESKSIMTFSALCKQAIICICANIMNLFFSVHRRVVTKTNVFIVTNEWDELVGNEAREVEGWGVEGYGRRGGRRGECRIELRRHEN